MITSAPDQKACDPMKFSFSVRKSALYAKRLSKANEKAVSYETAFSLVSRRRLIFPGAVAPSIVSAEELNFCVRYGYRWILFAITTGNLQGFAASKLHTAFSRFLRSVSQMVSFACFFARCQALCFFSLRFSSLLPPYTFSVLRDQALDRLVLASFALPRLHRQPIYHVVFMGSYSLSGWHTSS